MHRREAEDWLLVFFFIVLCGVAAIFTAVFLLKSVGWL